MEGVSLVKVRNEEMWFTFHGAHLLRDRAVCMGKYLHTSVFVEAWRLPDWETLAGTVGVNVFLDKNTP